jgi:hypothetical protein
MARKVQRIRYHLDPKGVKNLPPDEIKAILRGADDLIMKAGRTLLAKVLKGSRAREVLDLALDRSPIHGFYQRLSQEEILARIDWLILNGYLAIEYDHRLPLLVYTEKGWGIEKETYADELLRGFDKMLASDNRPFDMSYLKDRNRGLILLLLDKAEATGDPKYIPLLEAWEPMNYKKVRQRIRQVISHLNQNSKQLASSKAF